MFVSAVCVVFSCVCAATSCRLKVSAGNGPSNAVDFYHNASGMWSTAQLRVARYSLAATSVGSVAIFAGGTQYGKCSFALCYGGFVLE